MIEYTDYQYLIFDAVDENIKKWFVYPKTREVSGPFTLGVVSFQPALKKFVFVTNQDAVLDAGWLDEIRSFLVTQTTLWMVNLVKEGKANA